MYISQIYILSPRGDKIVFKDYRQDVPKNSDEIFFRRFKFWDGDANHQAVAGECPPFFQEKGIYFAFVRKNGLLVVATSKFYDISASHCSEVLVRTCKVLKDYLGVFSEEGVRKNFVLVYEILDEIIDVGVVQEMATERLKPYIFNDPIQVDSDLIETPAENILTRIKHGDFGIMDKTRKGNSTNVSVLSAKDRKNEIYIDIIERVSAVFGPSGSVINSEVDGSIQMKSFLAGSPDLYLGLNEDLVVGRNSSRARYATVCLDSVNFHESANFSRFEADRELVMKPPDGEFVVMNYRLTGDTITQPFRCIPSIEVLSTYKAEMTLRIRSDVPATTLGLNVSVKVPIPKTATSCNVELGVDAHGQTYSIDMKSRIVTWTIAKFKGATEQIAKVRVSTSAPFTAATRKELGPIMMNFEVPNHNVSGLGIKYMKLEERSQTYNPQRWVRNITQANSYVFRVQ